MDKIREEFRLIANKINIENSKNIALGEDIKSCFRTYNKLLFFITAISLLNYYLLFSFQNDTTSELFPIMVLTNIGMIFCFQFTDIPTIIHYAKIWKDTYKRGTGYFMVDIFASKQSYRRYGSFVNYGNLYRLNIENNKL